MWSLGGRGVGHCGWKEIKDDKWDIGFDLPNGVTLSCTRQNNAEHGSALHTSQNRSSNISETNHHTTPILTLSMRWVHPRSATGTRPHALSHAVRVAHAWSCAMHARWTTAMLHPHVTTC